MNQHKSLSTIINKLQRKELLLHMEYNAEFQKVYFYHCI